MYRDFGVNPVNLTKPCRAHLGAFPNLFLLYEGDADPAGGRGPRARRFGGDARGQFGLVHDVSSRWAVPS